MVRLELQLVIADLGDWHFRAPTDDGGEFAVVVGRQMHDHDVRDAEIRRYGVEESSYRFDSARGCADTDDSDPLRTRGLLRLLVGRHVSPGNSQAVVWRASKKSRR